LPAPLPVEHGSADFAKPRPGTIHIELRQAQVRIEGNADAALVRVLLECLRDDGATDEHASLVRRHGESLLQLLTRHDQAIDKALTLGILTDEINH